MGKLEFNEGKQIASGIGWSYGERLLAQAVSLIVSIILARLLSPAFFGEISIVMVLINILDAFVSNGFASALVQNKKTTQNSYDTICWFSLLIGLTIYVVLFLLAKPISIFYSMPQLNLVIKIMGIRIIITAFNSVQHAYVQKNMMFKKFFFSTLGGTLVSAALGIYLAYAGAGVWALVIQYLSNTIIDTMVLFFIIEWKPKHNFSIVELKSMSGFGLRMIGATLANSIQDNIRTLVVGKVFSATDLAYYNQGKKYPAAIMDNMVGSIQKVLFPSYSQNQCKKNRIKDSMRSSIRLSSYCLLPIIVGIIAVADTFVILVLTEKWEPCIPFLRILSLIYLTRTMNSIFQSGLLAIGRSDANLIHESVACILSIICIAYGSFVAKSTLFLAWSSVAVMIIGTGLFAYFVKHSFYYGYREMLKDFLPFLLLATTMGVVCYLVGKTVSNLVLRLIIQIIIGGGFYFSASKVLQIKEFEQVIYIFKQFCGGKNENKKRIIN